MIQWKCRMCLTKFELLSEFGFRIVYSMRVRVGQTSMNGSRRKNRIHRSVSPASVGSTWGELLAFMYVLHWDEHHQPSIELHMPTCSLCVCAVYACGEWIPNDFATERGRDVLQSGICIKSKWLLFKVKSTFDSECLTQLYTVYTSRFELHVLCWHTWWHATYHICFYAQLYCKSWVLCMSFPFGMCCTLQCMHD